MGPKWVQNRWNVFLCFLISDSGPLVVPVDVLVVRLEAYLGRFDSPRVPKGPKSEPFWDQKRVKRWFKNAFLDCALRSIEGQKHMLL